MEEEKWEVVNVSSGMIHANIVAGRLKAENIPVTFQYEAAGVIYGLTLDGLGEVRVMVPSRHVKRAREVLAESYEEDDIVTDC